MNPYGTLIHAPGTCECPSCHTEVTPTRPSRLWWIPMLLWWVVLCVGMVPLTMFPPILFVAMPLYMILGGAPVGYLGERMGRAPTCPACCKALPEQALEEAGTHGRFHRPAHA